MVSFEKKKFTNLNNIVRKFTSKEALKILKDLIVDKVATDETYQLILLWLTGLFNNESYAHLKVISGGNIITHDISANSEELIELVHDICLELMYSKINDKGKGIGLKYKVSWDQIPIRNKETKEFSHFKQLEGNEGMIVSFINRAFRNYLYKCLGKTYRGEISYSNLYTLKNTPIMQQLRERMKEEIDASITTPELIKTLREEDYSDVTIFQYRYIYSLGNFKNFTELTEDTLMKGSINKELETLVSSETYKKIVYEQMVNILNSNVMPKLNREFLKCYYNIPSVVDTPEGKKIFEPDMVLFFEMYPDYKKILKVRRISFSSKRRNIKWEDGVNIIPESQLYKESHQIMRKLLTPILKDINSRYSENLQTAKDLMCAFDDTESEEEVSDNE